MYKYCLEIVIIKIISPIYIYYKEFFAVSFPEYVKVSEVIHFS